MNTIEKLKDKKWMHKQYHTNDRSMQDIADELGTNRQRVRRAIVRLGIKTKDKAEAQKAALKSGRAQHPTEGTERPEDVRLRISESVAKDWAESTPEKLKNRSDKAKKQWENMPQHQKEEMLRSAREAVRLAAKEGSQLEKFLKKGLTEAGYVVQYHVKHLIANQNLEIDLTIPELSVAIEVDGPSHFLPIWGEENLQKNIKSDLEKTGLLLSYNMVVIRVKQLSNNVSQILKRNILNKLLAALEKIKKKFPDKNNRLIELEV